MMPEPFHMYQDRRKVTMESVLSGSETPEVEAVFFRHLHGASFLTWTVRCNFHPGRKFNMVWSCGHCTLQDPLHPAGIYGLPSGLVVCGRCKTILEDRKQRLSRIAKATCWLCVKEEVQRLQKINPELVKSLSYYQ